MFASIIFLKEEKKPIRIIESYSILNWKGYQKLNHMTKSII